MNKVARYIYNQKNFVRKIEMVYYIKKINDLFFDTSVIFKAELARMFMDSMCLDVDDNLVITASLVYSLKKENSFLERERIKTEKSNYKAYLANLGFDEDFCKKAMEYNRVNEDENYVRSKEGDVLELVELFGGMLLHREDRLGFAPKEAVEILKTKRFSKVNNRYFKDLELFVSVMESVQGMGLISKFQRKINELDRADISGAVRAVYDNSDMIENVFMLKDNELFEDTVSFLKLAKIGANKMNTLISYNKKASLLSRKGKLFDII